MDKKFKITYLLLGIGIGIIFASTLYSFYPKIEYIDLSDDIIIEKARELGMVSLKESINVENIEAVIGEGTIETGEKIIDSTIGGTTETEIDNGTNEGIEIIVESGLSSTEVANILHEAALIEDVNEFILLVREKKLDKKIATGKYKIKSNSSYDEIIETLTRKSN